MLLELREARQGRPHSPRPHYVTGSWVGSCHSSSLINDFSKLHCELKCQTVLSGQGFGLGADRTSLPFLGAGAHCCYLWPIPHKHSRPDSELIKYSFSSLLPTQEVSRQCSPFRGAICLLEHRYYIVTDSLGASITAGLGARKPSQE